MVILFILLSAIFLSYKMDNSLFNYFLSFHHSVSNYWINASFFLVQFSGLIFSFSSDPSSISSAFYYLLGTQKVNSVKYNLQIFIQSHLFVHIISIARRIVVAVRFFFHFLHVNFQTDRFQRVRICACHWRSLWLFRRNFVVFQLSAGPTTEQFSPSSQCPSYQCFGSDGHEKEQ